MRLRSSGLMSITNRVRFAGCCAVSRARSVSVAIPASDAAILLDVPLLDSVAHHRECIKLYIVILSPLYRGIRHLHIESSGICHSVIYWSSTPLHVSIMSRSVGAWAMDNAFGGSPFGVYLSCDVADNGAIHG